MSLGLGIKSLGLSQPLAGSPEVITPLRVIGAGEYVANNGTEHGWSSRDRLATRYGYVIGQDAKSLVFAACNWWFSNQHVDNTTPFEILEATLETASATYPILWGGNRNKVINAGDNNIQSDPLTAASCGLAKFSRDEQYWVKLVIAVATDQDNVPAVGIDCRDRSGGQVLWGPSALVSFDADAVGPFNTANTESRWYGFRLIMLGYPVADGASFITVGDSIAVGQGDNTPNGAIGRGMIQHAIAGSTGTPVNAYPNLNFGISGIGIDAFTGSTKWKSFIPYARIAIDQILTNNVDNKNVSQMQSAEASLWAAFRAGGVSKIIRTELLIRATSTNNWADTANQSVLSNWQNGANRVPQMIAWWPTKVSDGTIDYYVAGMRAAVADSVATDKWAAPKLYNADDVHPSNGGVLVLKSLLRTAITTVAASL